MKKTQFFFDRFSLGIEGEIVKKNMKLGLGTRGFQESIEIRGEFVKKYKKCGGFFFSFSW